VAQAADGQSQITAERFDPLKPPLVATRVCDVVAAEHQPCAAARLVRIDAIANVVGGQPLHMVAKLGL
jgi:hypothetical protein